MRKTKIICTIGPASQSPEKIREMIEAGMNVCRCNFSHGSYEEQNSFLGAIQKYFNDSGKTYNLQNFSYNLKNQIENLPALVIQNSYGFSPFLCANFYDLGLQKDIDLQVISKTTDEQSNLFQVEEISSEDITLKQNFFTENSIFAKVQNAESIIKT